MIIFTIFAILQGAFCAYNAEPQQIDNPLFFDFSELDCLNEHEVIVKFKTHKGILHQIWWDIYSVPFSEGGSLEHFLDMCLLRGNTHGYFYSNLLHEVILMLHTFIHENKHVRYKPFSGTVPFEPLNKEHIPQMVGKDKLKIWKIVKPHDAQEIAPGEMLILSKKGGLCSVSTKTKGDSSVTKESILWNKKLEELTNTFQQKLLILAKEKECQLIADFNKQNQAITVRHVTKKGEVRGCVWTSCDHKNWHNPRIFSTLKDCVLQGISLAEADDALKYYAFGNSCIAEILSTHLRNHLSQSPPEGDKHIQPLKGFPLLHKNDVRSLPKFSWRVCPNGIPQRPTEKGSFVITFSGVALEGLPSLCTCASCADALKSKISRRCFLHALSGHHTLNEHEIVIKFMSQKGTLHQVWWDIYSVSFINEHSLEHWLDTCMLCGDTHGYFKSIPLVNVFSALQCYLKGSTSIWHDPSTTRYTPLTKAHISHISSKNSQEIWQAVDALFTQDLMPGEFRIFSQRGGLRYLPGYFAESIQCSAQYNAECTIPQIHAEKTEEFQKKLLDCACKKDRHLTDSFKKQDQTIAILCITNKKEARGCIWLKANSLGLRSQKIFDFLKNCVLRGTALRHTDYTLQYYAFFNKGIGKILQECLPQHISKAHKKRDSQVCAIEGVPLLRERDLSFVPFNTFLWKVCADGIPKRPTEAGSFIITFAGVALEGTRAFSYCEDCPPENVETSLYPSCLLYALEKNRLNAKGQSAKLVWS